MMKKKVLLFLLIFSFGWLFTPSYSFACGNSSEKTGTSCCDKKKSKASETKDCCKDSCSSQEENEDGCDGKCKDTSCSCPSISYFFALPVEAKLVFNDDAIFIEKKKSYFKNPYLSSGFQSIWIPPNIN